MKSNSISSWVELKKHTKNFETIVNCQRILRKPKEWDNMAIFFKEADKHIK